MASHPREKPTTDPTTDELYGLLASHRRREVLSALATTDGDATVDALADRIAGPDADRSPNAETPAPARESVRAELLHVHLPKLADADLVEYDPDSGAVAYERAETAEALLGVTE